ncbi:head GIN domain-containing protein [Marinifilum flexuosum]|uniref:head GIN domain-containing protein n=1 Tax=Marinifilum flexuosum TaxID=1117708 RepID=UPI0024952147|nr:head GIN domain-containing protein [Marinifilum flexuosum]
MKSKRITSLIAIFALVLSSTIAFAQKTEDRKVRSFESISLSIAAKVYVSQNEKTSVKVKAYADDLDEIITEVDGSTLKIKRKKNRGWNWNSRSFKKVEVYISTPNVEDLRISGSGNIIAKTPIESGSVDYAISGSGNIIIDKLKAENVECHISGSGDIRLKGECKEELEIHISGSGDIEAGNFEAKVADIHISGSGDCKVYASESITARVAGSGDIYYRGNPKDVNCKSVGSGSIKSIGD